MRLVLHSSFCWIVALLSVIGTTEAIAATVPSHPIVAGFERFFTASSTNLVKGGELLLSELRCVNCHDSGEHKERIPTLSGPLLDNLPTRLNFDYLVEWLSKPHASKPGTLMPHLLSGESEQAQKDDATALAFYLFSTSPFPASREAASGSLENGRRLYHSIGCVACHAPEEAFKPGEGSAESVPEQIKIASIPLGNLQRKYSHEGLVGFLLDPVKWHPDARMPRTPMSESEAADLALYLSGGNLGSGLPALLPDRIEKGRKRFAELSCAACHTVGGAGESIPALKAKPLAEINAEAAGCLSDSPPPRLPDYQLSPLQRQAIIAALKNLPQAKPLAAAQRVHRHMLALNCYACHARDGIGGPETGRAVYFQTSGADLEDEGRFPPPLTGVGRKLLPQAIKRIVQGEERIRPYMTTRMPDFGEHHAEQFAKTFSATDLTGTIKPTPRDGNEHLTGRSPWGRELIGTKGVGCIYCHDLNGNKSLGIRAVDLLHAPKRLHPEWFRDYLIDPASFKPGTRMPSFWPEGKAVHELVGKNTARQIDSLWVYLTELDQNRLPEGMEEKGNFELKPTNAPIVFRTFMKDAGLHAISVGFPEGVHIAFDSEQVRWALAWRGQFLDAEGTWDDRFAPLAEPLGTNVLQWPLGAEVGDERQFKGYRLDARGVPTFLYQADTWEVEDTVEPIAGNLRRTLTLRGGSPSKWLGLLSRHHGEKIETLDDRVWSAGAVQLRLVQPATARTAILQNNGSQHLIVSPEFDAQGEAKLVMEVRW
ncbi:MAG: hypothetical protein H0X66_12180 [Verrucomicrobia bacterium]|nr:hypothetical protein [Verrucomicrobiota bacterium]